jgi:hypothetical protein
MDLSSLMFLGPFVVAFATASIITGLELVTSKYPGTWFLVIRDPAFLLYIALYGILAVAGFWLLDALVAAEKIKLEGLGLSSPWVKALYVGIAVKALLHINIAKVGTTPIGLELAVQLFEPQLLRTILLNEFSAVREYVAPYAAKYPGLPMVQAKIKANIPPSLPAAERAAFENDIDHAPNEQIALEKFLGFLGRRTFNRVFPP